MQHNITNKSLDAIKLYIYMVWDNYLMFHPKISQPKGDRSWLKIISIHCR
jgi:hypothetical protein